MYTVEGAGTYNLLEQVERRVVHDGNVVRIPTDRTAYVQHQFRHVQQHGRNLVGNALCRVEVASVEGYHLVVLCCVCSIEVVRANRITFKTDAEHLALYAVFHVVVLRGEYLVERSLQQLAVFQLADSHVLASVVHPQVHYTGIALRLAHDFRYLAATLSMLDPELAYALVGVGKRQVAALGV